MLMDDFGKCTEFFRQYGGAPGIASAALSNHKPCIGSDCFFNCLQIDVTVCKLHLSIRNMQFLQRSHGYFPFIDAEDLLHGIIGSTSGRQDFVSRTYKTEKTKGKSSSTAGNLRADDGGFTSKNLSKDAFQRFPADISVPITGASCEMPIRNLMF